jgi:hypothetical protein
MSGVRKFAVLGTSVLTGLSPLEAVARDVVTTPALPVASPLLRSVAVAILLASVLFVFWRLLRREVALGRGTPLPPAADIDTEWLERHLFSLSPELVGAAYDRRVAGPEVAAVLARMSSESKLASRVAPGLRGANNLELWLLADREELTGYERELVDALFKDRRTTSGDAVQQEYRGAGFEPAAILRRHLNDACETLLGVRRARRWPLGLALAVSAVALLSTLRAGTPGVIPLVLAAGLGALGPLWGAFVLAPPWSRDPERPPRGAWPALACAGASVLALGVLIAAWPTLAPLGVFGVAAWGLTGAVMVARAVASRESQEGFALRRNLLAARRFFAAELERPEPRIHDEWLPYLIALELTLEMGRWHLAYGRIETAARLKRLAERAADASEHTAVCWTGGAGALGGVGASGAWIAATSGLRVAAIQEPRRPGGALVRSLELGHV